MRTLQCFGVNYQNLPTEIREWGLGLCNFIVSDDWRSVVILRFLFWLFELFGFWLAVR